MNLRRLIDQMDASKEESDRLLEKLTEMGGLEDPFRNSLIKWINSIDQATNLQLIWINAAKEGLIQVEQRIDDLENSRKY